jgi:hypothetical protein
MPLGHTCILSYRHGQNDLKREIIDQLYEAIENAVRQIIDLPMYAPYTPLEPGCLYNEALAAEIGNSLPSG